MGLFFKNDSRKRARDAFRLHPTVANAGEKLHYLNPVPIHEIGARWIGKYERSRLAALADLKTQLESKTDD